MFGSVSEFLSGVSLALFKSTTMIKFVTFVILGVPLRILLMIMNGVSCFQLSLSFPAISNFEKFVICANYEADNFIFTTQSYIKCLRCDFLVNPLLKRDQSKIVINNSTCDASLFIINLFPMTAHSFPVPCYLSAIFHYFFC